MDHIYKALRASFKQAHICQSYLLNIVGEEICQKQFLT